MFKAPARKAAPKVASPAVTRARRSSVYHQGGKPLVSPPGFKSPPKVRKTTTTRPRQVKPKEVMPFATLKHMS